MKKNYVKIDNQSRCIRVGEDVYQAIVRMRGKTFSDKIRWLLRNAKLMKGPDEVPDRPERDDTETPEARNTGLTPR